MRQGEDRKWITSQVTEPSKGDRTRRHVELGTKLPVCRHEQAQAVLETSMRAQDPEALLRGRWPVPTRSWPGRGGTHSCGGAVFSCPDSRRGTGGWLGLQFFCSL